jgi:hypothetical protein
MFQYIFLLITFLLFLAKKEVIDFMRISRGKYGIKQTNQFRAGVGFDKGHKSRKDAEAQTAELFRQIGQLKVENDFLARKLSS